MNKALWSLCTRKHNTVLKSAWNWIVGSHTQEAKWYLWKLKSQALVRSLKVRECHMIWNWINLSPLEHKEKQYIYKYVTNMSCPQIDPGHQLFAVHKKRTALRCDLLPPPVIPLAPLAPWQGSVAGQSERLLMPSTWATWCNSYFYKIATCWPEPHLPGPQDSVARSSQGGAQSGFSFFIICMRRIFLFQHRLRCKLTWCWC